MTTENVIEFKTDPRRSKSLIFWKWFFYLNGWVMFSMFLNLNVQAFHGGAQVYGADAAFWFALFGGFWTIGLLFKAWRYFHYVEPVYRLNAHSLDKIHGWRAKNINSIPYSRIRMVKIQVTPGGFWLGRKYRDMKIDSTGDAGADIKIPGVLEWENIKAEIERRMS